MDCVTVGDVLDATELLAVYDRQLREIAEMRTATTWERHGPLLRAVYEDRQSFVT
jgi:hypothetical protein